MRWLVDACVDAGLVTQLRSHGHDVIYVTEDGAGLPDPDVVNRAGEQHRLRITEDKDFGDLVFRLRKSVPGVILLRIAPDDRHLRWPRLSTAIEQFGAGLFGRYIVVEKGRLRARPLLAAL